MKEGSFNLISDQEDTRNNIILDSISSKVYLNQFNSEEEDPFYCNIDIDMIRNRMM